MIFGRHRRNALVRLSQALLDADGPVQKYPLTRAAKVRLTLASPILRTLSEMGWLGVVWETQTGLTDPTHDVVVAPLPQRFYVVTDEGRRVLSMIAATGRVPNQPPP